MMSQPEGERRYRVDSSKVVARSLLELHKRASRRGQGEAFSVAVKKILKRLEFDPLEAGEPLYNLPALRLQIRTIMIRPLVVHYAVHQDEALVFVRGFELL